MPDQTVEYQLITLPENVEQSDFENFVNSGLAYCLKNGFDNVILNLFLVKSFQRSHLTIITRWLRNLQSLGGNLVLTGVNEEMLKMFRSVKISGMCDIYTDLEQFQRKNSQVRIIDITNLGADTEKPAESQKFSENERNNLSNGSEAASDSFSTAQNEDISIGDFKDGEDVTGDMGDMGDMWDNIETENLEHEGSITECINIQKLAQMSSEGDVSDKLSFLKRNDISQSDEDLINIKGKINKEEDDTLPYAPEIFESQDENYSNSELKTDVLPDNKKEIVLNAAAELPGSNIPSEEEINEIFKDFEDEQSVLEEAPVVSEAEEDASAVEIFTPVETEKLDYSVSKTGYFNELVEMSGEYECIFCKEAGYFLKGSRYERCGNPECGGSEKGWEPVIILF